jgi:hypothetical protein
MFPMKEKFLLACVIGLLGSVSTAQAAPQQYGFYASYAFETDSHGALVNDADLLFAVPTTIFGTFTYAANVAPLFVDTPATGDLAGYGRISYYYGSLSNLAGNVGGNAFSAATGSTLVADSSNGDGVNDGVFNLLGTVAGYVQGAGFSGFSIGGFNLVGVNIFSVGDNGYLASQALPNQLSYGPLNTGVQLEFEDSNHVQRTVKFWHIELGPMSVPIPATAWLFGSGLIGLAGAATRRKVA